MTNVMIGMPVHNSMNPAVTKAMWGFDRSRANILFDYARGYSVEMARNQLAAEFLEPHYNFEYLWFLDADAVPNRNTLNLLLDICTPSTPVALAWTISKFSMEQTNIFKSTPDRRFTPIMVPEMMTHANEACWNVAGGGLHCALIHKHAFEVVPKPWFKYIVYDNGGSLSEDTNFCMKVMDAGLQVVCSPLARTGHIIEIQA